MKINAQFVTRATLEQCDNGREFRLDEELIYVRKIGKWADEIFVVPEGFVTDLASTPRFIWSLGFAPFGKHTEAAVLHDFLYMTEYKDSRAKCDWLFLEGMKVRGTRFLKRWTMYLAVRVFGWIVWRRHDKKQVHNLRKIGRAAKLIYEGKL